VGEVHIMQISDMGYCDISIIRRNSN
jgi:hypothetical protein